MNDEMKRLAHAFAAEGFVVSMPDLFRRGNWFTCIRRLISDVKKESGRGVDDLLAAREFLRAQPGVDPEMIAVVGFCLGGAFALVLSKTGLFQVAAPFYGIVPQKLNGACPIVASYGGDDAVLKSDYERLEREVTTNGIPADLKLYAGAGHSFMNELPNRIITAIAKALPIHGGHRPAAEKDARTRVVHFIRRHSNPDVLPS